MRREGWGLRAPGARRLLLPVDSVRNGDGNLAAAGGPALCRWGAESGCLGTDRRRHSWIPRERVDLSTLRPWLWLHGERVLLQRYGHRSAQTGETASYVTRMLVRMPRDPDEIQWDPAVDWPNVTDQEDFEFTWWAPGAHLPDAARLRLRDDICAAGRGRSSQGLGSGALRTASSTRATVTLRTSSRRVYRRFVTRKDNGTSSLYPIKVDPTGGVHVKYVVAGGVSQSASELATFINNGYNRGEVDAYNIERDLGSTYTDFSTVHLLDGRRDQLHRSAGRAASAGQPALRRVGGGRRVRMSQSAGGSTDWRRRRNKGKYRRALRIRSTRPVRSIEHRSTIRDDAMLYWTRKYLTTGAEPPSAPRIKRTSSTDSTPVRDANGLVEGGLRHSFMQVPVALNTSPGCPFWGTYMPWSSAKIQSMYPTHGNYVSQVTSWDNYEVSKGWLLPQDSSSDIATAKVFQRPLVERVVLRHEQPNRQRDRPAL